MRLAGLQHADQAAVIPRDGQGPHAAGLVRVENDTQEERLVPSSHFVCLFALFLLVTRMLLRTLLFGNPYPPSLLHS